MSERETAVRVTAINKNPSADWICQSCKVAPRTRKKENPPDAAEPAASETPAEFPPASID